jgi:prenyl protein peptidase
MTAHIHHAYEFHLTNPKASLSVIVLRTLFQFVYTTIFGWYASFIYIHYQSLWAAVAVHMFCNMMGFPRFWGATQGSIICTWLYYAVLGTGATAFVYISLSL